MKTIFTQKSVVLEWLPIEKGSLVVYAGTAKKFTEKKPEECAELLKKKNGVVGVPVAIVVLVSQGLS